jgi:hypothetical protein
VLNALLSAIFKAITELTTVGTQTTPKLLPSRGHRGPRLVVGHGQLLEGLPGACFRFPPGRQNDPLEGFPQFA